MASANMSGLGMTLQTPPPLAEPEMESDDENSHTLTELVETDNHFKEIDTDFKNAGMKVIKVEMLKNKHLWKRYATERNLILEQREKTDTDFKLNERYLYHGTSAKKSYVCDEGLDSRMSNEGCFGKGIYFSDYPKKCVKYAKKGNAEESYILLVRVILGLPKVFPKGKKSRGLRREPEKEEPYTGHRFYDSVEGCPVNHKEFVVYESRRALVEGIITFSVDKKEKKEAKPEPEAVDNDDLSDNLDDNGFESENSDASDYYDTVSNASSDDGDNDDKKEDGSNDSSHSSDTDHTDSSSDEEYQSIFKSDDEIEKLVIHKKQLFGDATGLTDELEIERYLLRGNMNVDTAVKIYKEKKSAGFPESEDEVEDEEELFPQRDHPLPNSEGWNKLSKEDQEVFIEGQIDDFLLITGLDVEERDFARKCLSAVNMNLDHAVLAYYEDL